MKLALVLAACAITAAGGCRSKEAPPDAVSFTPQGPTGTLPLDHLADGELIEGKEKAFTLTLPRDLKLTWTFNDRAMARGDVEPERVANYVRARVKDGKITAGATVTVFEGVHTLSDPVRPLRIRIEKTRGLCQLEVRDITLPPDPDPGADEATRWRRLGLAPNGQPLDPQHMQ